MAALSTAERNIAPESDSIAGTSRPLPRRRAAFDLPAGKEQQHSRTAGQTGKRVVVSCDTSCIELDHAVAMASTDHFCHIGT